MHRRAIVDPIDIQYALKKRRINQVIIARETGVSAMTVSKVIHGKLRTICVMENISAKLGKSPQEVFEKYPAKVGNQ